MMTFELSFYNLAEQKQKLTSNNRRLGSKILLGNVRWFVSVRWIVSALFLLVGAAGFINSDYLYLYGFVPPRSWPFFITVFLIISNSIFCFHMHSLDENSPKSVEANLWMQIILDLLVVTVVVYFAGSVNTFIPFIYIFHIAMACIFFRPLGSFVVMMIASLLYITVVLLQLAGILQFQSIVVSVPETVSTLKTVVLFKAGSVISIWAITWYLVSSLSRVVRTQEENLRDINKRLAAANIEKTKRVLVTTHELKTPFSDIETLINKLKYLGWEGMPPALSNTINMIAKKSKTMRVRIDEILKLGNLRMQIEGSNTDSFVDIRDLLLKVMEGVKELAVKKDVKVKSVVGSCRVTGTSEHLAALFSNLIVNAVVYSKKGGEVKISMSKRASYLIVKISDNGIGIKAEALPHIFDEYFRTDEGKKANNSSTGLGLSIVKEIAKNYQYGIKVESEQGIGTIFMVRIPQYKI